MKSKKLLILMASATLALAGALVACDKKVEKIDVLKKDMPQLVYVQGNDLNLSTGQITAVVDGKTKNVPLNNSAVSVSGYDKNKLGEQILTVTYEKKSTTIKVTVVPRIAVEKHEASYFVGEVFDDSKGELVITNDDGTNFVVDINDETVKVSNFTTETADDEVPVSVNYTDGDVSYDGVFNIAVYDVASIDFKAPNKKEYENHETELDVSGGYLSLTNADETFTRYLVLDTDMVSGFDLSAATLEHRETPLTQTLKVTYLIYEKEYDIQIKYSDLSLIRLRAEEMKDFEWTEGATPEGCTTEMGDNALEAMEVYFAMEDAEKTDVTAEEVEILSKTAATYGVDKWKAAFESYKDAFYLSGNNLYWDCTDFEKTKAVYTSLKNKNPVIYEDSVILKQIEENFADTVIVPAEDEEGEDVTIGSVLSAVYSTEMMDNFAGQLELMTTLYETLKDVPDDWTLADLQTTYKTNVESAWVKLRESEYTHVQYRNLYSLASRWRTNDDFFDILYAYYYDETNLDGDDVDLTKINAFKDYRLPGDLETLYTHLYSSKTQAEYMINGYQIKSEDFLYNYEQALKVKKKILETGSEMEKDLYDRLTFDYLISDGNGGYILYSFDQLFDLLRRTNMGYLYHYNAYLGVPELEGLWGLLLEVIEQANVTGEAYYETTEFATAVEAMFKEYMGLLPTQKVFFMNMLNPYYTQSYPLNAWDDSEVTYNSFVFFVYKYYRSVLPESTHDAFYQLMLACEALARKGLAPWHVQYFTEGMETVADYLDSVEEEDKNAFLNELKWFYNDFYELATVKFKDLENPVAEDLGEWKDEFEDLYAALAEAFFTVELNTAFQQQQKTAISLSVIAAYEKAEIAANKILSSGDEAAIKAYSYDVMQRSMIMFDGSTQQMAGTADFLMFYMRNSYATIFRSTLFTKDALLYDYYNDINDDVAFTTLKEFLSEAHYLYYTYVYWQLVGSSEQDHAFYADADQVMKIMETYRTLSVDQQHFISTMDQYGMYRNSIVRFAKEQKVGADALAAVEQLMKVEYFYTFYQKYPDASSDDGDTYLSLLNTELQLLLSDYYELSKDAEALDKFTSYFGEMYNYYLEKCKDAGLNTTFTPSESK